MTTRRCADQFRRFVVRPTLEYLGLWSPAAEALVTGTGVHESGLQNFDQWTGAGDATLGPAYGLFQIEPATNRDVWENFLRYRPALGAKVAALAAPVPERDRQLVTNLAYATAICRVIYYRAPEPLPAADDVVGLAAYWKAHFNSANGAGTPEQWVYHYRTFCG